MDIFLFNLINHLPHFPWTDGVAIFFEWMGEKEIIFSGIAILFIYSIIQKDKAALNLSIGLFLSVVLTCAFIFIAKHLIGRPRPDVLLPGAYLIGSGQGSSFPSGHAALYASVGGLIILFSRDKRSPVWVTLIVLGGVLRIYQGMHYPTDVLFGWLAGLFFAWLARRLFPLIEEKIHMLLLNKD